MGDFKVTIKSFLKFLVAILFVLLPFYAVSQKQGNIWCFGDSAGIEWTDPQNPTFFESASSFRGSCASIANTSGNLLFYCANVKASGFTCDNFKFNFIYNKNHEVMEDGSCLPGVGWYYEHTIIPFPESDSLYYVFSIHDWLSISYNLVDISANDGLGKVIERDHQLEIAEDTIFLSTYFATSIAAVKHGNGRDWWVITKSVYASPLYQYNLFLVTPEGVTTTYIPSTGNDISNIVQLVFNHRGDKFYSVGFSGQLQEYNFNRCNGDLTLNRTLDTLTYIQIDEYNSYTRAYFAAELSPNDRFLYISTLPWEECSSEKGYLLQFDLWEENPIETIDTLSIYGDALDGSDDFRTAGALKLAPDGKIYLSRGFQSCTLDEIQYPDTLYTTSNTNLSVINHPDSLGAAANFEEYSFYLGGNRTYKGLPNNPNYNLAPLPECDTLASSIKPQKQFLKTNFNIFPNPCYTNCILEYKPAKSIGNISISNMQGKIVFTEKNIPVTLLQHGYELNTSAFAKGVYTVMLITGGEVVTKRLVKL